MALQFYTYQNFWATMQRETDESLRRLHFDWRICISRHATWNSAHSRRPLASLEFYRNITLSDEAGTNCLRNTTRNRETEGAPACQRLTFSLRSPNATTIASLTGTTPEADRSSPKGNRLWSQHRMLVDDKRRTNRPTHGKEKCRFRGRK